MKDIRVQRIELLGKIKANRALHRDIFQRALVKFRERALEELDRRLLDIRHGRKIDLYIGLPRPEDHTADYDRVIQMLEKGPDRSLKTPSRPQLLVHPPGEFL